jgi:hypothetical protein
MCMCAERGGKVREKGREQKWEERGEGGGGGVKGKRTQKEPPRYGNGAGIKTRHQPTPKELTLLIHILKNIRLLG